MFAIFNGDLEMVEEGQKEVQISFYVKLEKFHFRSSFKTYFYAFTRNKAIDLLRKEKQLSRNVLPFHNLEERG